MNVIEQILSKPLIRNFIDSLPQQNKCLKILKPLVKALLFRRRIIRGRWVLFEGIEDAVLESFVTVGQGRGEVLVETICSAVSSGTERACYLDLPNFHQPRPFIPGYSGCGIVRAKGKKVDRFQEGDLVAGIMKHAEINVAEPEELVTVPGGVGPREASFVTLGVIAGVGARVAGIEEGNRVAVLGQGIIGQMVNQISRIKGAREVVAVAKTATKKELSRKSGVDEFIDLANNSEPLQALQADIVFDITGNFNGFETALGLVRPGGRVVMLGSIPEYAKESNWAEMVVKKDIEVRGAHIRNLQAEGLSYRGEAGRFLNLLAEKKIKLDHLITDVYPPDSAPEIYRHLASGNGKMVGVLIKWRKAE